MNLATRELVKKLWVPAHRQCSLLILPKVTDLDAAVLKLLKVLHIHIPMPYFST